MRDLGSDPQEYAGRSPAERQLAEKIRKARKAKQLSPEQEAELQAMQQADSDATAAARIAEAEEPPNPMEGFAEEAQNRIDQDLLMLEMWRMQAGAGRRKRQAGGAAQEGSIMTIAVWLKCPPWELASRRRRSLRTPWTGSQKRRRTGSTRTC